MFKVWNVLLCLLFVCNAQASDEHIVDDKGLRGIVFRNRSVFLHNDLVKSLHSDDFKHRFTPDQRAAYLHELRRKTVNRYCESIGNLDDYSEQRPDQLYDGVWQINPHHSRDIDKKAMSDLLWIRNFIKGTIAHCDKIMASRCSLEQLAEIKNKVCLVRIERDCIAHCLGDDDDSDTEALVK